MVSCAACLRRQTYRLAGPSTCRALHSSHPPPAREDFQSHRVDLHDPSDLLGYRGPDGRSGFGFRPSHHPSDQSRFNNGVGIYVRHPDDLKPPPVHEPDPAWICSQFAETPRNTRATGSSRITGTDQWLLKRMNEEAELEDGIDFDSSSTAESSSSTMDTGTYIRAPIPKRPERRKILPKFDPLPVDEYAYSRDPQTGSINAGMVRHNWRSRSRSGVDKKGRDTEKAEGDKWFPDLPGRREDPPMIRLDHGVTFRSELDKYTDYFEPLLDAEHQEEKARYKRKLRETPVDQLQRLGVTLSRLHPVPSPVQPKSGCYVDFKHLDKQGNPLDLPGHLFELRKSVLISTKLPLDSSTIHGMVISIGRNFIRVRVDRSSFETMPPVQYRMDMGMSDHVYKVQRQAIRLMNLDPIAEDAETSLYMVHQDLRKVMAPLPHTAPSSQERSPQNEGSGEEPEPIIKRERALHGTALRHSLLRAFQERFVPYHASAGAMPFTPSTDVLPVPEKNDSIGAEVVTSRSKIENANSTHSILYRAPEPDESHLLYFNQQIQSWIRRHLRENPVRCEGDPRISLNPSQIRAIAMMLSKKLSLIQGPPGTGKTRVIIEAINLLKKHWQIPHPILVTAHTNVAVDNLLAGLRAKGVKALRIGSADKVPVTMLQYTYDMMAENHPIYNTMQSFEQERARIYEQIDAGKLDFGAHRRGKELLAKITRLKQAIAQDVLADADVICTTCLSAAGSRILGQIDFPIVFLDEASMATEPLSLIPFMKGSSQVAIIGDHKQLPPVITSDAAKFGGLSMSLFERLVHEQYLKDSTVMLDTQYRMHPSIAAFASKQFYNSELKNGTTSVITGKPLKKFDPPVSKYLTTTSGEKRNVMFVDHDSVEMSSDDKSTVNYGEAQQVAAVVTDLLLNNPALQGKDIGIIAPYAGQIRLLTAYLHGDSDTLRGMRETLGRERAQEISNIEIKTVDGFEGREKEVIIFSTTRSNEGGFIGFLADWRRLNVGITRAKRGLVILGNAKTLRRAKIGYRAADHLPAGGTDTWKAFIKHLEENGEVRTLKDILQPKEASLEVSRAETVPVVRRSRKENDKESSRMPVDTSLTRDGLGSKLDSASQPGRLILENA